MKVMNNLPYKITANPHLTTGEAVDKEDIKKHICDALELEDSEKDAFMRNQIWKRLYCKGGNSESYLKYVPPLTQASAIYHKLLSAYRVSENLEMLEIFNKLTQNDKFRHSYRAIKYFFDKKYKFVKS